MWIILGLGNPDAQYDGTRHSVGRNFLEHIAKRHSLSDWKRENKKRAVATKGELFDERVLLVLPETDMNESGLAAKNYIASVKAAEKLVVLHDDLDLPVGKVKISFGAGAGGHKGVQSMQTALKTK
ncbi:MAG: aminoacyl-tRNA hydrolase, partial [Minisyncoccia bacterium]